MKGLISIILVLITFVCGCSEPEWLNFDTGRAEQVILSGTVMDSVTFCDARSMNYNGRTIMLKNAREDSCYKTINEAARKNTSTLYQFIIESKVDGMRLSSGGNALLFFLNSNDNIHGREGFMYVAKEQFDPSNEQLFSSEQLNNAIPRQIKKISDHWYLFAIYPKRISFIEKIEQN